MTHSPPIPEAARSPYPVQEPPHLAATETSDGNAADIAAPARDAVGPLVEKAKTFAKARPYATAALVGTVALALFNTLRGKRA